MRLQQPIFVLSAVFAAALITGCSDDSVESGPPAFAVPASTIAEGSGPASIEVIRTGSRSGPLTAVVVSTGGTATAGDDYETVTQTLTWAPGDGTSRTVNVTVNADQTPGEADETVVLTLAASGDPANVVLTHTLTITNVDPPVVGLTLNQIGRYTTGVFDGGATEISAYDAASRRVFVTNGSTGDVDILDLQNPATPTLIGSIDLATLGPAATSVAVADGVLAVAIPGVVRTDPGTVALFNAADGTLLDTVTVGALPDALVFSADGNTVVSANEGEPSGYGPGFVDPEGSVSIIDVTDPANATVRTAGFAAFNDQADALRASGVRIYGPGSSVAQDLEPEYPAISADGSTVYVSLQENNAIGIVDVATATVTRIAPLGFKDHSLPGNEFDASDRDSAINIRNWPVFGMYQPDTIAAYSVAGETYLVTANEGDAREYDGLVESVRVGAAAYVLDPTVFPTAADLKLPEQLGRLNVTNQLGDTDGDGDFDAIYAQGARSFSILDATGAVVFDSGAEFETMLSTLTGNVFNASNDDNDLDSRSDSRGPEPEGVTVATFGARSFAFIGLERQGGIMVYDVSTPTAPTFVSYFNNRLFAAPDLELDVTLNGASDGDLGPEGLVFIPAADSPTGDNLLVVTNEVSGTTTIYRIDLQF